MKLKTLAKVTLALGLLSASTMATEGQTGHAKEKQEKKQYLFYTNILKGYYTGKSYKLTNINGKSQEFKGSNVLIIKIKIFKCLYLERMKINIKKKLMD